MDIFVVNRLHGWYNYITMSDEERKLMISMARALEALGTSVKELHAGIKVEEKPFVPVVVRKAPVFNFGGMVVAPRAQISQVESGNGHDQFKMDIKFEGLETRQPGERMEMSAKFIGEMEMLFRKYQVSKLEGTYICQNL